FLAGWIVDALERYPDGDPAELARLAAVAGRGPQAFTYARRAAFTSLAAGAHVEATQLFAMARTFASSPEQLAEIESALESLGAVATPNGTRVGVARSTARGMDLLVLGRDRRDSVLLLRDLRSATPFGWSPDGVWFLAARSDGRASDLGLYAYRPDDRATMAIDTLPTHTVTEALWSPD